MKKKTNIDQKLDSIRQANLHWPNKLFGVSEFGNMVGLFPEIQSRFSDVCNES